MRFGDILKFGTGLISDVANEVSRSNGTLVKSTNKKRSTDDDYERNKKGMKKRPEDFEIKRNILLSQAVKNAKNETGVYIIYLDGQVMKCGRAAYSQGIRWRMQQYYNLKYDSRAQHGDCWAIDDSNRDRVMVSWQCCPVAVCKELEYKLFKKYGKGPWGLRAPVSCNTNDWKLLI